MLFGRDLTKGMKPSNPKAWSNKTTCAPLGDRAKLQIPKLSEARLPLIPMSVKKLPSSMKKHILLFCAFSAVLIAASLSFAASPFDTTPPAPAAVNIYDWYNLGEYLSAASQFNFNVVIYPQMDDHYKKVNDLMVKAHLSDGTLAAFKQWYPDLKALPWDKDWITWTKEQQNSWKNSPLAGAWFNGVRDDASHSGESLFFYFLGRHTLDLAWAVPYFQSQGWTKDANAYIASAAADFLAFSTNSNYSSIFSALTPDVQNAITLIGAAKSKISGAPNPFDNTSEAGLRPDDFTKIIDAAKQIRAAAQGNKLTK
jgi:hypothetical protein